MTSAGNYKLECYGCGHTVQVPAVDRQHRCPNCGAALLIQWNAARAEFDRAQREAKTAS
jgi:rRNA maturation endonuclease Nob1